MKEFTCCFTGHRKIPPTQYDIIQCRLEGILIDLIHEGYRYFGAGGALGFDTMAASTVLKLQKEYPWIRLILVLPCRDQAQRWSATDQQLYEQIKRRANKVVYTSDCYTSACMFVRNRHLVDCSSVCVCYLTRPTGGTAYTVKYAQEKHLKIINLESSTQ